MPHNRRFPDNCEYRTAVGAELARCQLLEKLSGVEQVELCNVPLAACRACCECFAPSVTDPNPVVASLLHQLSDSIVAKGGVPGCDRTTAEKIRHFAAKCLPKTAPQESDRAVTQIPDYSQPVTQPPLDQTLPTPPPCAPIQTWAVAVTTAPRRLPTIDDCLDSLVNAGWPNPRIFSDSYVPLAKRHVHMAVTLREPAVGAWPNYYLTLAELLMREPDADAYLIVQDDVLFYNHTGLRDYLEGALWQTHQPCMASLFCPRDYTQPICGWTNFQGDWLWGAQAFVFSRSAAQRFLADDQVVHHRWNSEYEGSYGIDWLIGKWAGRCQVPIRYPTPSLVQHIGHVSAIWGHAHIIGPRRADQFAGDNL